MNPAQCGIYCLTCLPTGQVYVGSALLIERRWRAHRSLLNRGRHHNSKLQGAWSLHGPDAFTWSVLEVVEDAATLIQRERLWIRATGALSRSGGFNYALPREPGSRSCAPERSAGGTGSRKGSRRKQRQAWAEVQG